LSRKSKAFACTSGGHLVALPVFSRPRCCFRPSHCFSPLYLIFFIPLWASLFFRCDGCPFSRFCIQFRFRYTADCFQSVCPLWSDITGLLPFPLLPPIPWTDPCGKCALSSIVTALTFLIGRLYSSSWPLLSAGKPLFPRSTTPPRWTVVPFFFPPGSYLQVANSFQGSNPSHRPVASTHQTQSILHVLTHRPLTCRVPGSHDFPFLILFTAVGSSCATLPNPGFLPPPILSSFLCHGQGKNPGRPTQVLGLLPGGPVPQRKTSSPRTASARELCPGS